MNRQVRFLLVSALVCVASLDGWGLLLRAANTGGPQVETMTISSSAFQSNQEIPRQYSGEGADISPPLAWSAPPAGTKELVLIVDDPDAPSREPWVHWLLYKIPAETRSLPENVRKIPTLNAPILALQGKNSFGRVGYNGPMPPKGHGTHHYHFRIYALDQGLTIPPESSRQVLENAMKSHVLATGDLVGTYKRD